MNKQGTLIFRRGGNKKNDKKRLEAAVQHNRAGKNWKLTTTLWNGEETTIGTDTYGRAELRGEREQKSGPRVVGHACRQPLQK